MLEKPRAAVFLPAMLGLALLAIVAVAQNPPRPQISEDFYSEVRCRRFWRKKQELIAHNFGAQVRTELHSQDRTLFGQGVLLSCLSILRDDFSLCGSHQKCGDIVACSRADRPLGHRHDGQPGRGGLPV